MDDRQGGRYKDAMRTLWQQLNRPLVVLLVGFALWPLVSGWRQRIAVHSTADAIFQELGRARDQMDARAKNSGIKALVNSFASQIVDGLSEAFDRFGSKQDAKLHDFTTILGQVSISDAKVGPSQFESRDRVIGTIHNGSSRTLSGLHLNLTLFSADGHLLDVVDKDLSDLKALMPGQTIGFEADRELNVPSPDRDEDESDQADPAKKAAAQAAYKAAQATYKTALQSQRAAKVTAQIISFSVEEPSAK